MIEGWNWEYWNRGQRVGKTWQSEEKWTAQKGGSSGRGGGCLNLPDDPPIIVIVYQLPRDRRHSTPHPRATHRDPYRAPGRKHDWTPLI
jgi:hypothetical protein